jgi:hypothetical protein
LPYATSDEKWDLSEEEDIAVILSLHANKRIEALWFRVWSTEVVNGENRRIQQVVVELLQRQSHLSRELFDEDLGWESSCLNTFVSVSSSSSKGGIVSENIAMAQSKRSSPYCALAYVIPVDLGDDHLEMTESQAIKYLKCFAVAICQIS